MSHPHMMHPVPCSMVCAPSRHLQGVQLPVLNARERMYGSSIMAAAAEQKQLSEHLVLTVYQHAEFPGADRLYGSCPHDNLQAYEAVGIRPRLVSDAFVSFVTAQCALQQPPLPRDTMRL